MPSRLTDTYPKCPFVMSWPQHYSYLPALRGVPSISVTALVRLSNTGHLRAVGLLLPTNHSFAAAFLYSIPRRVSRPLSGLLCIPHDTQFLLPSASIWTHYGWSASHLQIIIWLPSPPLHPVILHSPLSFTSLQWDGGLRREPALLGLHQPRMTPNQHILTQAVFFSCQVMILHTHSLVVLSYQLATPGPLFLDILKLIFNVHTPNPSIRLFLPSPCPPHAHTF